MLPQAADTPIFEHAGNYAGRDLRPIPPLVTAEQVAAGILACARDPKREVTFGRSGQLVEVVHVAAPASTTGCFRVSSNEPRSATSHKPPPQGTSSSRRATRADRGRLESTPATSAPRGRWSLARSPPGGALGHRPPQAALVVGLRHTQRLRLPSLSARRIRSSRTTCEERSSFDDGHRARRPARSSLEAPTRFRSAISWARSSASRSRGIQPRYPSTHLPCSVRRQASGPLEAAGLRPVDEARPHPGSYADVPVGAPRADPIGQSVAPVPLIAPSSGKPKRSALTCGATRTRSSRALTVAEISMSGIGSRSTSMGEGVAWLRP